MTNWKDATIDYEEVDFNVPQPAWIKDTYHWSCTLLKMGRFAEKPITYHDFRCEGLQPKHGGVPLRKEDDWPVPQEINSNAKNTGS